MEYVGNLCSPCPLHELSELIWLHKAITCVPHGFSIRRNILLVHVLSKETFVQALKVLEKFLKVTFVYALI